MRYKIPFILTVAALTLLGAACSKPAPTAPVSPANTNSSAQPSVSASVNTNFAITPAPTPNPGNQLQSMAVVNITASGFSPSPLTIKAGRTVNFVNQDSAPHWPASDPHPIHTLYPGFDALKGLAQGENYSFTFTRVGTWTYHDHLHPTTKGTIIVTP